MYITSVRLWVGIEVLTALTMRSTVSLDVALCSLAEVYQHLGATYRFHLQGRRVRQTSNRELNEGNVTSQKIILLS
jgi:hypothetical protein